jgi:hypothetical protein
MFLVLLQDILQTQLSLAGHPADDNSKALFFNLKAFDFLPFHVPNDDFFKLVRSVTRRL